MIYSLTAGDSSVIWDFGFAVSDPGITPVVLADMSNGFSCHLKVPGTAINRAVITISQDGKYFRAFLSPSETANLSGLLTLVVELRNASMVPPLVRETQLRIRVRPGFIDPV